MTTFTDQALPIRATVLLLVSQQIFDKEKLANNYPGLDIKT